MKPAFARHLYILLLTLSAAFSNLWIKAACASNNAYKIALLFSHSHAGGRLEALRHTATDTQKLKRALIRFSDYKEKYIYLAVNKNASEIRKIFRKVKNLIRRIRRRNPKSRIRLFVHYAGHSRNKNFLLGSSDLPFKELHRFLKTSGATLRLTFLDTCGAGDFLRARGLKRTKKAPFKLPPRLRVHISKGEATLTATGGSGEKAYEDDRLGGGIFTYYTIEGLKGEADRDMDGYVNLHELYLYVHNQTLKRTTEARKGIQKARFYRKIGGIVIMSNIQKNTALLYLHPMLTGNLLLWTSTGPPYRIPQKKGKARLLRLPAGYYHIKWRYHKGLFQTQLRLQKGQKLSLHSILKQRSNHYKYRNFPSRGKQQKKLTSQAHTQSPSGTQQKFAKTPSSNWSFFIEGGPVGALMLGNIISAGGSFGLQHRFFGIRLGTWGTSVPYGKKHLNLHIALQIDLGYRWDWGMFSFFVGGYGGVGWLFQDIGIATLSGPLLHFGVTLSPGIWFSRRWGLVLRLNLGGDSGLFGGDLRIYLRWHTGLGVQFRL